jgi:hypothetical protein
MADEQDLDVVQHPTLGTLKFPKDMPPEERNESIQRVLMMRPDAQAPPSVPMPKTDMQPSSLAPQPPTTYKGIPGTGREHGPTGTDLAAMGIGATLGLAPLAAPAIAPIARFAGLQMAKHPFLTYAGIEGAKRLPGVGPMLNKLPGLEYMPFLAGKGEVPGAGRIARIGRTASEIEAPTAAAEEATLPAPKGEIARTPKPADVERQLNEGLGGRPLQPNVPLRQQGNRITSDISSQSKPTTSSAIQDYKYDPARQEMQVTTKAGAQYIHGDVSPEQAAEFEKSGSKGKAWGELKKNSTYVGKIVNGQRINAKPPSSLRSASPDDLTPILRQSLENVKAKKAVAP